MRHIVLSAAVLQLLVGCGSKESEPPQLSNPVVVLDEVQPEVPEHNYVMKEGRFYGYEPALSDDDRKAGKVTAKLMMFGYTGEKDGKYQVVQQEDSDTFVAECSNPCEFIKFMRFTGQVHIKTEYLRAVPSLLIRSVLEDATKGQMEQVGTTVDGKRYSVWYSESGVELITPPRK